MNRPGIVWVFTILSIFGLFSIVAPFIDVFVTHTSPQSFLPHAELFAVGAIIWGLLILIFLYLFFMLKKSSLIFLYITLGYAIIFNVIIKNWIIIIVEIIFNIILWDYIKRKKVDGQPVFN
jgi:hypothetical protein